MGLQKQALLPAMVAGALLCGSTSTVARRPAAPVSLPDLFTTYASGDFDVVSREIGSAADCPTELPAINRAIDGWKEDWTRTRAVFLLEVAIACQKHNVRSLLAILSAGATFVIQRPTPRGPFSPDFSFEVKWHLAALGLLQVHHNIDRRDDLLQQLGYLDVLAKRFKQAGVPEITDRFALARGMAFANQCCTQGLQARAVSFRSPGGSAGWVADQKATWDTQVKGAIKYFDRARRVPETRREGSARGALLLLYRNKPGEALAWLDGIDDDPADPVVSYWTHTIRGRIFDSQGRVADAEREYVAALRLFPDATAVAQWRSVDLMRLGRAQEAVEQATALSRLQVRATDPWRGMDRGDFRFVTVWRDELRKMMR